MIGLIRRCPKCHEARPLNEIICQTPGEDGASCNFPLINVRPTPNGATRKAPSIPDPPGPHPNPGPQTGPVRCPNGHVIEEGDRICIICGAEIVAAAAEPKSTTPEAPRRIEDWTVLETLKGETAEAAAYLVRSDEDATPRLMRFFVPGVEPENRIYPAVRRLDTTRIAKLVATGRTEERAYEVWDELNGPTIASRTAGRAFSPEQVREIVRQVAEALATLELHNLRHGNLNLSAIRLRSSDPIDLQVGELSTSTLAEFSLEIARTRPLSRYQSPETIVGASSQASDWWSLGIILLELLTKGCYFDRINDRAFLLHVVARSLDLPRDLGADWTLLVKGLLTRDHDKRWRGAEVERWLLGHRDIPVHFEMVAGEGTPGQALNLGGRPYRDVQAFALAAAQAENWDEALALTEMGTVATWITMIDRENPGLKRFKQLMEERRLERDYRFALALLALNEHLPLSFRGDIQTPNRFLERPEDAGPWLEKVCINALVQLKREAWIVRLPERAGRIRARAEELGIDLVEDRFRVARLAVFETRLEEFWRQRRRMFPDSTKPGLAALAERRSLTDEDLILLICAYDLAFRSSGQVIAEAGALAREIGVKEFDVEVAGECLGRPKRELVDEIEERVGAFRRTARQPLDDWADALRLGRRLPLAQLLVLRAVPESQWEEPPHQDYLRNILEFLQKKILSNLQRGPLVKLMIGRSASRIDVTDLGERAVAETLIERTLSRNDQPLNLNAVVTVETREKIDRLKRIAMAADVYRRETGVSALVLAFPIITFDDRTLTGASSIRIAPLALWPLKIKVQAGQVSISYDGERDPEANPALERVLGTATAIAWCAKFEAIVRDGVERIPELFAAFSELAPDADPLLRPIPGQAEIKGQNRPKLIAAGAFMLADFPSQAIVGDLRTILGKPIGGTVLKYLLRIGEAVHAPPLPRPKEKERFTTLDADPSQEEAVLAARQGPGLKLEGPPGTVKSQTIVNIVTDCIGRGESVMLVCEKQVALEVVHKRLRAEGLDRRVVRIENTQSDRGRLLVELQSQIPQAIQRPAGTDNEIRTQRHETASIIDQLEADLSTYHGAVYAASGRLGLSYRDVIARIAGHEPGAVGLSAPILRPVLGELTPSGTERTAGECLGLLEVWLQADFTDDTLRMFRVFASDTALETRLKADFKSIDTAENERRAALKIAEPIAGLPASANSNAIALWRRDHEAPLASLSERTKRWLSAWRNLLESKEDRPARFGAIRADLGELIDHLATLIPSSNERAIYAPLSIATEEVLVTLAVGAPLFAANRSFFAKLNSLRP
jgi:primosomal replication protein N''